MVDDMDANEFQKQYAEGERNFFQVNLSGANLSRINLSEADLDSADLTGANISEANLSNANLRLAKLIQADLRGTDLSEATLTNANLREALYDEKTKFPDKFDPVVANLKLHLKTPSLPPDIDIDVPTPDVLTPDEITPPSLGSTNHSSIKKNTPPNRNKKISKRYLIPVVAGILTLVAVIVFQALFHNDLPPKKIPIPTSSISSSNSPQEKILISNPRISSGDKVLIENEAGNNQSFKLLNRFF